MKTIIRFFSFICAVACISSCEKSSSYSDIPEIEFKKLVLEVSGTSEWGEVMKTATLIFSFIDGNGDLGVRNIYSTDTLSRIYVIWQQKKDDGSYEDYEFNNGEVVQTLEISYDKDKMDRDEAHNKILKGTIETKWNAPSGLSAGMDTVRLEYYIMDRALNRSNTEYTPDFSILDEYVEINKE